MRIAQLSLRILVGLLAAAVLAPIVAAQGPMPEEGATLFPHGAFLSYNSIFTRNRRKPGAAETGSKLAQPTFVHEMPLEASWSPRRDLQLSLTVPFLVKHQDLANRDVQTSGLGDAMFQVKYRFLRRDSSRGTSQASLEAGPKFPTGSNSRSDVAGELLAPTMQLGSGSLDWHVKLTSTFTGLLGIRRLVADAALARTLRTDNAHGIDMGDDTEARLWIHFRPLQTKLVGGEWFIGPDFHWQQTRPMLLRNVKQPATGSDIFTAGITTYISPRGGLVFWASLNFPIAQDWNGAPYEQRSRLSFGITKQFVLGY